MDKPKFAEGERVAVQASRGNPNIRPGVYTIVRLLPIDQQGQHYRAKSAMDNHERVFLEGQLSKI